MIPMSIAIITIMRRGIAAAITAAIIDEINDHETGGGGYGLCRRFCTNRRKRKFVYVAEVQRLQPFVSNGLIVAN